MFIFLFLCLFMFVLSVVFSLQNKDEVALITLIIALVFCLFGLMTAIYPPT